MQSERNTDSWLSNEGYNLILRGLSKLEPQHRDQLTKDVLLVEKFTTEKLLERYGLGSQTKTSEIPGIDQIFNLSPLAKEGKKRNLHLEIMGMPKSGKDTLLQMLDTLNNKAIICTFEPYASIKNWKKTMPEDALTQEHLKLAATFGEFISGEVLARRKGLEKGALIIHNRGFTDHSVFTTARLMYGEIPLKDYFNPEQGWIFRTSMAMDAVIILMQGIETSTERQNTDTRPGKHLTPDFLTLLYEQYLREIIELKNKGQGNLVVFDSSEGIENNFQKLKSILSKISGKKI